jgi:membrane protease YdiL (CAAX protease family)
MKDRFQNFSPFGQLVVLILMGAVSFFVLSILVVSVCSVLYPEMPLNDVQILQEKYPVQFMMMNFFPFQTGFMLIPGLVFLYWGPKNIELKRWSVKGTIWSILLFISVLLLLPFLSEINNWITVKLGMYDALEQQKIASDDQLSRLLGETSEMSFFIGVLTIGLLTGIAEELAFRRLLMGHMLSTTNQFWLSLIGSSFIFALLHFNYLQFIPLFMFGIALGLIFYYSGSVWLGAILHALNNIVNVWWLSTDSFPKWMETVMPEITIPSTLLLMGLIYYKFFRKRATS